MYWAARAIGRIGAACAPVCRYYMENIRLCETPAPPQPHTPPTGALKPKLKLPLTHGREGGRFRRRAPTFPRVRRRRVSLSASDVEISVRPRGSRIPRIDTPPSFAIGDGHTPANPPNESTG